MTEKRPRLKPIKFPKAKIADDTKFVETLVWVLNHARAGNILGYAMVYIVKGDEGRKTIESASVLDSSNRLEMLGAIEGMKLNFVKREWPEE